MTKYALYYAVERITGKIKTLQLEPRSKLNELKIQIKKDIENKTFSKKYSQLILTTDYGLIKSIKLSNPEKEEMKAEEDPEKEEMKAEEDPETKK